MYIVFGHIRKIEIHHLRELVDIQPPGGDVGGHQNTASAGLEIVQGPGSGVLALVPMDGGGLDAALLQPLGQAVRPVFGAAEHQRLVPAAFGDQLNEKVGFPVLIHRIHRLGHGVHGGIPGRNRYFHRIGDESPGQGADFVGKSGGKHQVLPLGGQDPENSPDVVNESHVQHTVGFVQHQGPQGGKIHRALGMQVEQTPGGGHQYVHSPLEFLNLGVDVDSAEHHRGAQGEVASVGDDALFHLGGEFPGGGNDEGAEAAPGGA